VRVSATTDIERVVARETLRGRRVEVERAPVDRMLDEGEGIPRRARKATPSSSRSSGRGPCR
jgi:hypothetical protein